MAAETIDIGGEDQPVGGDQTSQGTEVGMWKCQLSQDHRMHVRTDLPKVADYANSTPQLVPLRPYG
ncbi:hypothetical protein F2Q69_00055555 [Brassica cretica]|uniref:Uncharacterized protein n=1 Tax=Brassica cretica TaxID=69181 RepID=A0A8S9N5Q3_BRACR|nr:hypothetical protein F2Q69_00055555 [Brassica cretica]